ncbi:sensor histidine kinase [Paenibacillus sp. PR3]|uniref:histidine kinase n=1 Tax=Paenibacillus terricola TaxID=2763503 RepID=A0ABR8N827_9BACL|nr:sensor histidine kinase [Paenibacillus terricola]MBD3922609.1 sensor histidine kinase [Paenibacillus terricola]
MKWSGFSLNNQPIRYKLVIHFLLIGILPAIGLGVLIDWTASRIIERQVNDYTIQMIGKVNDNLEHYVENAQNMTYLISFDPNVDQFMEHGKYDEMAIRTFMTGFTTLHTEVASIVIANDKGSYISNEMYVRSTKSLTEDDWYKQGVQSKGIFRIIGHPSGRNLASHVDYKDSEVVSFVRAVVDPITQDVKGVIMIDLKLRVFAETVKDVRLGKSGYLMVVDDSGDTIYAPDHPLLQTLPEPPAENGIAPASSGTYSAKVDGRSLQFIYRTSPFTNWMTVGVFPSDEPVSEMREIRFYVISFAFLVCLLGITASYYLSHSMSRPIGQLMSFMQKAESGDLTIRYWGDRQDEVGKLGRSFNLMLAQINRLITLTELQERQKREAELRSLQAHIKPHFLYNTLDTIQWMARRRNADDVADVVGSLSKLFRIGLNRGSDMIPLAEEFEHISSYMNIQQTRYSGKISFTVSLDPAVADLYVLKLMLQPIVENAIYHGVKERRGPGVIDVSAKEEDGAVLLRVADDGAGIPPDKLARLLSKLESISSEGGSPDGIGIQRETYGKNADKPAADVLLGGSSQGGGSSSGGEGGSGYGMMNVQARVRIAFGDIYGVKIESQVGQGTVVTIRHPIIRYLDK